MAKVEYEININEQLGYLSIIIEHKSYPDKWLPLQLYHYQAQAMMQWHKQHPGEKLPLIYGLVLYHGQRPYSHSLDISTLINAPQALIDKYFLKPPQLLDLTKIDNETLKAHAWSGALLLSLKNIFIQDFLSFMKENLTEVFRELIQAGGEPIVRDMLEYYVYKGNIANTEQFSTYITQQVSRELGDEMATLAEQWQAQGYAKGSHAGMKKSAHKIAENLLVQGLVPKNIAQVTELPVAEVLAIQEAMADAD